MNDNQNRSPLHQKLYSSNGVMLEAGFYTRGELEQMILMIENFGRMHPDTPIDVIRVGDD